MIRFILRRIFHAAVLAFVIVTVTFVVIHLAPGDPATRFYSPEIDPRVMEAVRGQLGLDRPLPVQYAKVVTSFLHGDFGVSLSSHRPVSDVLGEAVPRTLQLTALALLLQIGLGLALGMLSAFKRHGRVDGVFSIASLVLYSIPSFYLAYFLIAVFSLELRWLPSASMSSVDSLDAGFATVLIDRLRHLVLPVGVLAIGSAAAFARFARGSLLDVIGQDFVRTARAKGLGERAVIWKHVLKNALPQMVTVIGLSIPFLLGGAVIVEKIFAWPGMGSLLVDSIYARDYPVVLAVNLIAGLMVVLGNLLADLSYAWVDPRMALHKDTRAPARL
jgi:peptide/nickel transport system permease protein